MAFSPREAFFPDKVHGVLTCVQEGCVRWLGGKGFGLYGAQVESTTKPHLGHLARGTASSCDPYIGENSAKRMAQHLLSSAYATPGRRASGRIGVVPNDPKVIDWGRFNPRGLVVAQVVTTAFVENVRAPCFVMATSVMKGK